MCMCVCVSAQSCLTLYDPLNCSLPGPSVIEFYLKNPGMGCHFLLQAIFPTQGLNLHLLRLPHCRRILLPLSHREAPVVCYCFLTGLCSCQASLVLSPNSLGALYHSLVLQCLSISFQIPLILAWTLSVTSDTNSNQNWLKLQREFLAPAAGKS